MRLRCVRAANPRIHSLSWIGVKVEANLHCGKEFCGVRHGSIIKVHKTLARAQKVLKRLNSYDSTADKLVADTWLMFIACDRLVASFVVLLVP
jgi:hypothetical protein